MSTYTPSAAEVSFWEAYCAPIVHALDQGRYELPEIQARFLENRQQIFTRYNVSVLNFTVDVAGQSGKMGSSIEGGPQIWFYLKVFMIGFDQLKAQCGVSKAGEVLRDSIAIGIIHETDHLALGTFGGGMDFFTETKYEQVTWAATCEHALRPMIEIHKRTLLADLTDKYKAWVSCGRNAESSAWRQYIRKIYR